MLSKSLQNEHSFFQSHMKVGKTEKGTLRNSCSFALQEKEGKDGRAEGRGWGS